MKCEGNGYTFSSIPVSQSPAYLGKNVSVLRHMNKIGPSVFGQSRVRCDDCAGKGEKLREKDK